MKKIAFLASLLCATFAMATPTITGMSQIDLSTSGQTDKYVRFVLADEFSDGFDNTWDTPAPNESGIYVYYAGERYIGWASNQYTANLPLGFYTGENTSYALKFSNFSGTAYTIYDRVADKTISVASSTNIQINGVDADPANQYTFTIDESLKNSQINDRFIINYVAPTCTTVRTGMVVDNYYTICLPKAVNAANGASFWNMSNRGAGVAYLEEAVLPLVAGRPYIIQAEDVELCVEYSGDAADAGAFGALHGTLVAMDQAALDAKGSDIYLLKNNELWLVSGQTGNSLAANRAYIKYDELNYSTPSPAPGRRVRAIPMQDQSTTGVENLNAAEAPVKTVIDGKMYILRGEHMFDATGRMVK